MRKDVRKFNFQKNNETEISGTSTNRRLRMGGKSNETKKPNGEMTSNKS